MTNKEVKQLLNALKKQGFTYEQTSGNHIAVFKDGVRIYTMPSTPSDFRSLRNSRAELAQYGFVDPKKPPKPKGKR